MPQAVTVFAMPSMRGDEICSHLRHRRARPIAGDSQRQRHEHQRLGSSIAELNLAALSGSDEGHNSPFPKLQRRCLPLPIGSDHHPLQLPLLDDA